MTVYLKDGQIFVIKSITFHGDFVVMTLPQNEKQIHFNKDIKRIISEKTDDNSNQS